MSLFKSQNGKIKVLSVTLAIVIIAALAVGVTVAAMKLRADSVTNTITAANGPAAKINETFTIGSVIKKDVSVTNSGDVAAYVRCMVTYNLLDDDGNIVAIVPHAGYDYITDINTAEWTQIDGIWYCNTPVAAGGTTPIFINSIKTNAEDYRLDVTVSAQLVQANPDDAVEEAWGVSYSGGTVSAK